MQFEVPLFFFTIDFQYNYIEIALQVMELIFLLDIFLNMFIIREEDIQKHTKPITSFNITCLSYFSGSFWFDFLVWVPWGDMLSKLVHPDLIILDMIKTARILNLNNYFSNKIIKEKCCKMFDVRFKAILEDPFLREDFNKNRTMIEARILISNIAIALKIFFYTVLTLYFTGSYWLLFSLLFFSWVDAENYG